MPDWSYHTIFKPILHRLPPTFGREFIHRGMSFIASSRVGEALIEFLGHMAPSKQLEQSLFGVKFTSPVGLSGNGDPHLTGLKAFQNLGFGFIEIGPVSISGTDHEEKLFLEKEGERIKSAAFSIKLSEAIEKLQSMKKKVPVFARVEGTFQEIEQICDELRPYSDGFILNSNTIESDQHLHFLKDKFNKPVILACSAEKANHLKNYLPSGILLEGGRLPQNDTLASIRKSFNGPIIISGGIREPADAVALLEGGASLVMLGYEYVFSGPGLSKRINEAYSHRLAKEEVEVEGWR